MSRYTPAPAKYPNTAKMLIFLRYHTKSMRSRPITATPAAVTDAWTGMFVQDGIFWQFLAYCAGTGGSALIIGSAAGVAVMGLEKIDFVWYMKRMSLLAIAGYLAGAAVYWLMFGMGA